MKNMVMFVNVGLVRSTSMFMYEWKLKTWGKKEKHCVCCVQGHGLWVSIEREIEQEDLKTWNRYYCTLYGISWVYKRMITMTKSGPCNANYKIAEGQREMGWNADQTVNLLFMHAHVAFPSGRCTTHWFRCVI